jgi:exonuclease VII small subunit
LKAGGSESRLDTASKMVSERPLYTAFEEASDEKLRAFAQLRRPQVHLDDASRAFLLRKQGVTDPAEAERLVDSFETTLALDEVINEYRMGPAILRKLSDPVEVLGRDLEAFNQWVYEDVFRQPLSDPWLGLAPEDVYAALPASSRAAGPAPRP